MIALMPPTTSSSTGAAPAGGQIPFNTYNGDVPLRSDPISTRSRGADVTSGRTDVRVDDTEGGESQGEQLCASQLERFPRVPFRFIVVLVQRRGETRLFLFQRRHIHKSQYNRVMWTATAEARTALYII